MIRPVINKFPNNGDTIIANFRKNRSFVVFTCHYRWNSHYVGVTWMWFASLARLKSAQWYCCLVGSCSVVLAYELPRFRRIIFRVKHSRLPNDPWGKAGEIFTQWRDIPELIHLVQYLTISITDWPWCSFISNINLLFQANQNNWLHSLVSILPTSTGYSVSTHSFYCCRQQRHLWTIFEMY